RRLTGVDLGLAHPLAQRLRVHPQPARDRLHRRPLRVVVVAVLADQSYRPGLGVLVVPDRHRAILPTKEVRIKPGTVQTEPRPAPWRTAARFVSCLPLGPHAWLISASNIAAITASPAATLIAISPSRAAPAISASVSWISSGRSGSAAASAVSTRRTVGTVFMSVPYSFFEVFLVVHPKTYHPAG